MVIVDYWKTAIIFAHCKIFLLHVYSMINIISSIGLYKMVTKLIYNYFGVNATFNLFTNIG